MWAAVVVVALVAAAKGAAGAASVDCTTDVANFDHPGDHDFAGTTSVTAAAGVTIATDPACAGLAASGPCHVLAVVNGACIDLPKAEGARCNNSNGFCDASQVCVGTRTFFVTNNTNNGDYFVTGFTADLDALCQSSAEAGGILGAFYWLGLLTTDDRLVRPGAAKAYDDPVIWVNPNKALVFQEEVAEDIRAANTTFAVRPNINEFGDAVEGVTAVWMGTVLVGGSCGGTPFSEGGAGFTAPQGSAEAAPGSADWKLGAVVTCDTVGRVYCVEGPP